MAHSVKIGPNRAARPWLSGPGRLTIIARYKMLKNSHQNLSKEPQSSGHHRPGPWTVANFLTLVRIALILPFIVLAHGGRYGLALAVFFAASLTDFADGYVARTFNQQSYIGQILDPLADKLLVTASFIVMAIPHSGLPAIPVWVAGIVILRDLAILLGSLIIYVKAGFSEFKPSWSGKVNTLLELGLIVVFLAFHSLGVLLFLLPIAYAIVIVSVMVSAGEYYLIGLRILRAGVTGQGEGKTKKSKGDKLDND